MLGGLVYQIKLPRFETEQDALRVLSVRFLVAHAPDAPNCPKCSCRAIRWGKDRAGNQRFKCKACGLAFADIPTRPLGRMRLSIEKATLCIHLLTEGSSIRSTERVSGVHRDTIMSLLRVVGGKCETLLTNLVHAVPVADVQCDELWCVVGMKEKTKVRKGITSPEIGDAYTFLGIERDSKLILAHQVGRRTADTNSPRSSRAPRSRRTARAFS